MKLIGANVGRRTNIVQIVFAMFVLVVGLAHSAFAQSFNVTLIVVEGNRRIETATIQAYTEITTGENFSAAEMNDAVQRVRDSGLFETVTADMRGEALVITVAEHPTVNVVAFEGNSSLDDNVLVSLVQTTARRVYSASQVRDDANLIAATYANQGRMAASVEPRLISRDDNRVDVVFEIVEGGVVEVERISFVGNRDFSDRRLRRVLGTKQAGLFRLLVQRDTFTADRITFDKQVLTDFYTSRGYVDFQVLSVNSELSKDRDSFFVTFQVQEGQQFKFGEVTTTSDIAEVNPGNFDAAIKVREGSTYSPNLVEDSIARMERRALELGLDFIRIEPRLTRNSEDISLDLQLNISRGPRVFVERIDIKGNTTTLDRVIRRTFKIVEGDPFNPREIRASAERIRALGFFKNSNVKTIRGSSANQVIVNVDVTEQPTGSLSFGGNYNTANGASLIASFRETNFLGRGQSAALSFNTGSSSQNFNFSFKEPSLLNRDLSLGLGLLYGRTNNSNARYDTEGLNLNSSLGFQISENGRLGVKAFGNTANMTDVSTFSPIILNEAAAGRRTNYGLGYTYSFDDRRTGLNPKAGVFGSFGQDFALFGDSNYVKSTLRVGAETLVWGEDIKLSAVFDAGALTYSAGSSSSVTDRYFLNSRQFRGFAPGGLGPRQIVYDDNSDAIKSNDALGGNYFAVARFESKFPLGLPEEYGISGGAFIDIGSSWGLDAASLDARSIGNQNESEVFHEFALRSVVGVSIFWKTPIGPLRFNWTETLKKQTYDTGQSFDFTVSTSY